jgi:tetratricopeptide (TPR) repeat protein
MRPAGLRRTVFISYSQGDAKRPWLARLQVHLKRLETQCSVERWDDTRIKAGADWRKEIDKALSSAVAAVLLITENFIASDFISKVELPQLLSMAERKGTLIIPVIAMPCSFSAHPRLSKIQAINSPERTLASMTVNKQEELWTKVVKQIEDRLAEPTKRLVRGKTLDPKRRAVRAEPQAIPRVGLFLGRTPQIHRIQRFLSDDLQSIAIVQGFYGIGKTALMARLVELSGHTFRGICWLTCSADRNSADVLFSILGTFLAKHGDRSLQDIWNEPDPTRFRLKLDRLAAALASHRYLIVFDGFEEWLNADLEVNDERVRNVFMTILRARHDSKIVIVSRKRPLFDPSTGGTPLGSYVEEIVLGLDTPEAIELLRASGLDLNESLLTQLAQTYDGNPQLLQIASFQIRGLHRDPEDLIRQEDRERRIGQLLEYALGDLSQESREALELLAALRRAITRVQIAELGIRFDKAVAPLLNRFIAREDAASHVVSLAGLVRRFVAASPSISRNELHTRAAEFWHRTRSKLDGGSETEKALFGLEEAYHRRECGDFLGASSVVAEVARLLIDWGYIDQAEVNLQTVIAQPAEPTSRARALVGLGRIADLRGQYQVALPYFRSALTLFEAEVDWPGVAEVSYRIGRIHNARDELDDAEVFLRRCIAVCRKHRTSSGLGGAYLALGWNHEQRGKPPAAIARNFALAIRHSTEAADWASLCAAHRSMGFLLWVRKRDERASRENYERARDIAGKHDIVKEMNAIEIDLAFLMTQWGDAKGGEECARRALDMCTRLDDTYSLANAYSNLGVALAKQERWPDAASAYEESRRLAIMIGNFGGEVFAARGLARIYATKNEHSDAESLLRPLLVEAKRRQLPEHAHGIEEDLRKTLAKPA